MTELAVGGHNLIGSTNGTRESIKGIKAKLAGQLKTSTAIIGHCTDGRISPEFGPNSRFQIMRTRVTYERGSLVKTGQNGEMEIVPNTYLGSARHTQVTASRKPIFVHFYLKRKSDIVARLQLRLKDSREDE